MYCNLKGLFTKPVPFSREPKPLSSKVAEIKLHKSDLMFFVQYCKVISLQLIKINGGRKEWLIKKKWLNVLLSSGHEDERSF